MLGNKKELLIIDNHFEQKIFPLIHFARRANRITMGFEAVKKSIYTGKSRIILIASDIAENTLKKLLEEEFSDKIQIFVFSNMNRIAEEFNINRVAIISINDINFAKGILKYTR